MLCLYSFARTDIIIYSFFTKNRALKEDIQDCFLAIWITGTRCVLLTLEAVQVFRDSTMSCKGLGQLLDHLHIPHYLARCNCT